MEIAGRGLIASTTSHEMLSKGSGIVSDVEEEVDD